MFNSQKNNSETQLCAANNTNNQLNVNGTSGNYNNNARINSNKVRVALDFCCTWASPVYYTVSPSKWFETFQQTCKNKSRKPSKLFFELYCWRYLYDICESVNNFEYIQRRSTSFIIDKPKKREIISAAFSDRIVQTYFVNQLINKLEVYHLNENSYSCRVNKGALKAVKKIQGLINNASIENKNVWIYKFDFKSFFISIDTNLYTQKLIEFIEKHYEEDKKELLIYLAQKIYLSTPEIRAIKNCNPIAWNFLPKGKSLNDTPPGIGIPIGNITSQMMANFCTTEYLNYIDLYSDGFAHYTDDNCGITTNKELFLDRKRKLEDICEKEYHLKINEKKFYFQHYTKGVEFLGFKIKANRLLPSNRLVNNLMYKIESNIEKANKNKNYIYTHKEYFISIINSYFGLIKQGNTYKLRKRIAKKIIETQWGAVLYFNEEITKANIKPKYKLKQHYKKVSIKRKKQLKTQEND